MSSALGNASNAPNASLLCNGPLEYLRALVQRASLNSNLKFEVTKSLDALRETLELREQQGLEYIFARCVLETCFGAAPESEHVYDFLLDRFRSFDRRKQELAIPAAPMPLTPREPQLTRVAGLMHRRTTLFRAIHLAEAIDCDGPWTKSEEKDALFGILARVMAGGR
jgi:hypothetical protein